MKSFRTSKHLPVCLRPALAFAAAIAMLAGTGAHAAPPSPQDQVFAAERAFARTMASRDVHAFAAFVSEEAVFFGGGSTLRGREQILGAWSGFFADAKAPFSWDPDQVEVLDSGTLALSTGLVKDAGGKVIARFNSIWRREAADTWRVVFDKGSPLSQEDQKQQN